MNVEMCIFWNIFVDLKNVQWTFLFNAKFLVFIVVFLVSVLTFFYATTFALTF